MTSRSEAPTLTRVPLPVDAAMKESLRVLRDAQRALAAAAEVAQELGQFTVAGDAFMAATTLNAALLERLVTATRFCQHHSTLVAMAEFGLAPRTPQHRQSIGTAALQPWYAGEAGSTEGVGA